MNPAKHPSRPLGVGEKGVGLLTYEQARKKAESISERARILVSRVCVRMFLCLNRGVGCACFLLVDVCYAVCCSMLQCVALCCCVLQCVVVCVQCVAMIDVHCV